MLLRWARSQRREGVRVPSIWTWSSTLGRLAMNGVISRPFMIVGFLFWANKMQM